MADSIRQQIMAAYETQLKTVTVANGYNTAMGSNIQEWKATPWAEEDTIGLDYRDEEESVSEDAQAFDHEVHSLRVRNEILIIGTTATMRKALADLVKCIGANNTLGGLCSEIAQVGNASVNTEHANKRAFAITVMLVIRYFTHNFDPYS